MGTLSLEIEHKPMREISMNELTMIAAGATKSIASKVTTITSVLICLLFAPAVLSASGHSSGGHHAGGSGHGGSGHGGHTGSVEITSPASPNGIGPWTVGDVVDVKFMVVNAPSGATWSITGSLPHGVIFKPKGELSGIPSNGTEGSYQFKVRVQSGHESDEKEYKVDVISSPTTQTQLNILTNSLPDAEEEVSYSADLDFEVSQGQGTPPYVWSLVGTGSPSWINLSTTGTLSGTPPLGSASPTPIQITVQVRDSASPSAQDSDTLQLTIAPSSTSSQPPQENTMTILTSAMVDGVEGTSYQTELIYAEGVAPYFTTTSVLPNGLTLLNQNETAVITGTLPAGSAGDYGITISVVDSSPIPLQATTMLTLHVSPSSVTQVVSVLNVFLPSALESQPYTSVHLRASGGSGNYAWSVSGMPSGLALNHDGDSWFINGLPAVGTAGLYSVTIEVIDELEPIAGDSAVLTLSIQPTSAASAGQTPELNLDKTLLSGAASGGCSVNGNSKSNLVEILSIFLLLVWVIRLRSTKKQP